RRHTRFSRDWSSDVCSSDLMLAISGDKIDNIPGVPGIGYSTAAKILQKFAGIDCVLANLPLVGQMKFRGAARAQALLRQHGHIRSEERRVGKECRSGGGAWP